MWNKVVFLFFFFLQNSEEKKRWCWRISGSETDVNVLANNMSTLTYLIKLNSRVFHFSAAVFHPLFSWVGIPGHSRHPLTGILSDCETLEPLHGCGCVNGSSINQLQAGNIVGGQNLHLG